MIIPERSAFTESRLARARSLEIAPGIAARLASAEDVILNKLLFYKLGKSRRHLADIANILKVQRGSVDRTYVEQWAARLGVSDEWNAVREPFLFGP